MTRGSQPARRLRAARAVSACAAIALASMLPACASAAPAIQEVSPFKGQGDVPGDAPVTVAFDREMDHYSVSSRLELNPPIEGCDPVACPLSWNGNTVRLDHPDHPFAGDTKYRVLIHPGYRDTAGVVNDVEHLWEFRTEPAPELRGSSPSSGATDVAVDADLSLQFTRGMLAPGPGEITLRAGGGTGADVPYHLALGGGDASQVTVASLRPLRPNTKYRLSVAAGVEDIHHNHLGRRADIDFTTGDMDLSRSLGFVVSSASGQGTRVAVVRPPASLGGPLPTVRVLYDAAANGAIHSWAWSSDARFLYVLQGEPAKLVRVDLASGVADALPVTAASFAASPGDDEVAYVTADGELHLWSVAGDVALAQAGRQLATPAWSDDGRRLATVVDAGAGAQLAVIDRGTLSRYLVEGAGLSLPAVMRWSHDGSDLAFVRQVTGAPGAEAWIYHALAAQGPLLQRVGPLPAVALAWSSDELTLFAATAESDPLGRVLQRAPARPAPGQDAAFAPLRGSQPGDSAPVAPSFDRRLAFLRVAAGQRQLWVVNNDGTGLLQLTSDAYEPAVGLATFGVAVPAWAPGSAGGG